MKPVKLSNLLVAQLLRELAIRLAATGGIILAVLTLLALAGGRA